MNNRYKLAFALTCIMFVPSAGLCSNRCHRARAEQAQQVVDLAAVAPSVQVLGPSSAAHLKTLAIADLNGDGIPDVVLGAPDATLTVSASDVRSEAGVVYIVYGRPNFPLIIDGAPSALNQPDVTIIGHSGDRLGAALAVGDINGDGLPDLIIGATGAGFPGSGTAPARPNTGAVFVVFGGTIGQGTIDLAETQPGVSIFGARSGDLFGAALAIGSLRSSATSDLVIGAPMNAGASGTDSAAGAVYVVYGSADLGNPKVVDLGTTAPSALVYGNAGSLLGTSVAVGDIDADGNGDILIGAPQANRPASGSITAAAAAGAVYAIFGGQNLARPGVPVTFSIDGAAPQSVSLYGQGANDNLGSSLASADVTGDGKADLIVGAPNNAGPGASRAGGGAVYLLSGGAAFVAPAGGQLRLDIAASSQQLTVFGAASGDHFGSEVAAGVYNVPGNTSRTPGILAASPFGEGTKGSVSLFFGGSSLTLSSTRDLALNQDDLRVIGQTAGDELGSGIATGNIDATAGSDLVVSSGLASPLGRTDAGSAYFLLSSTAAAVVPPTVSMTASPSAGPAPLIVAFTASAKSVNGPIVSYSWDFGDGTSGVASSSTSHVFPEGGFQVRVTVTDSAGATAQALQEINATGLAPLGVSVTGSPTSGNAPLTVAFTPQVSGGTGTLTYSWDFGDGSSSSQPLPSHVYTQSGNYTARVSVTDGRGATGVGQTSISVAKPNLPPTVTVLSPKSGDAALIGTAVLITWTANDADGDSISSFDVMLSTDGGVTYPTAIATSLSGQAHSAGWTAPLTPMANLSIQVIAHDSQGAAGQASSGIFAVVDPGVPISFTAPTITPAQVFHFGQQVTVAWEVPQAVANLVQGFDLSLSLDGQTIPLGAANPNGGPRFGPGTFTWSWTVPAECADAATLTIVATDIAGIKTTATSPAFAVHDTGPSIVAAEIHRKSFVVRTDGEVPFQPGVRLEISTDSSGTTFAEFSEVILRHRGQTLIAKKRSNLPPFDFWPDGAIRIIRVTNPVCGVTTLSFLRSGRDLVIVSQSASAHIPRDTSLMKCDMASVRAFLLDPIRVIKRRRDGDGFVGREA